MADPVEASISSQVYQFLKDKLLRKPVEFFFARHVISQHPPDHQDPRFLRGKSPSTESLLAQSLIQEEANEGIWEPYANLPGYTPWKPYVALLSTRQGRPGRPSSKRLLSRQNSIQSLQNDPLTMRRLPSTQGLRHKDNEEILFYFKKYIKRLIVPLVVLLMVVRNYMIGTYFS
jgi:hypothetical protein